MTFEAPPAPSPGLPLYAGVKRSILDRIRSGEWASGHRIPSESELVAELGVSRMTVNRALRELSMEGVLVRMQGLGSFVAEGKQPLGVFEMRSIAEEIAARGHAYSARIVTLDRVPASPEVAAALAIPVGGAAFHSLLVHQEDGIPIQIEERHVNPAVAPAYLDQDFAAVTPNAYLMGIGRWTEVEHQIEAVLPAPFECRLMGIPRSAPCLLIRRRTWIGDMVASSVRLLSPGSRYRIENRERSASA